MAQDPKKPCVFIHTNDRQMLGALVSEYSLKRNSAHADSFDVRFIHTNDKEFMHAREGQLYLRDGDKRPWRNDDLQSFTPLRFMPPELMGYQGRALVIDPDVFAVRDVWELLSGDMHGKAIVCRPKSGSKGRRGALASSVMLLDCARLGHWNVAKQFSGIDGVFVQLEDTIRSFREVLEGKHDDVPEMAFYMVGGIDDVLEKAGNL